MARIVVVIVVVIVETFDNIEWEILEITSRKSEIPREHFMQIWAQ